MVLVEELPNGRFRIVDGEEEEIYEELLSHMDSLNLALENAGMDLEKYQDRVEEEEARRRRRRARHEAREKARQEAEDRHQARRKARHQAQREAAEAAANLQAEDEPKPKIRKIEEPSRPEAQN